jgi:hypothetical protein
VRQQTRDWLYTIERNRRHLPTRKGKDGKVPFDSRAHGRGCRRGGSAAQCTPGDRVPRSAHHSAGEATELHFVCHESVCTSTKEDDKGRVLTVFLAVGASCSFLQISSLTSRCGFPVVLSTGRWFCCDHPESHGQSN